MLEPTHVGCYCGEMRTRNTFDRNSPVRFHPSILKTNHNVRPQLRARLIVRRQPHIIMNTDKRILSITAFVLFICGLVTPLVQGVFSSEDVAIIFAIVATVLALILGILGRSFFLGKVAAVGALIVCVIGTINYIRFRSDDTGAAELRMHMEQQSNHTNTTKQ
jgi:hypothetical protein